MGYSKDGPSLKFTSLFFKDKNFISSFDKDADKKKLKKINKI